MPEPSPLWMMLLLRFTWPVFRLEGIDESDGVPTLQQRIGNRFWAGSGDKVIAQESDPGGTPYANPEEAGAAIEGSGV